MTFAKESWPFVTPFAAAAAALLALGHPAWGAAALATGAAVLLFFRIPSRSYAGEEPAILAAADGRVLRIDRIEDPEVGPGRFHRVVTFLSVFDVHVQRAPLAGEVTISRRRRGRKVAAFRHHAGDVNEQHLTVLRAGGGATVGVRQIAGLVARRVVCHLREGQAVQRGQLLGLIKFGSRVDLLVPEESYRVLVAEGDYLKGGATPVARPAAGEGS